MIWATVSSWSCLCWLYRASPSLTVKNIISLISVLPIWWCPCVECSPVLLEKGVCYDQCIFLAKLYKPLPCFILYSRAKFACYCRYFLTSYFKRKAKEKRKDKHLNAEFQRIARRDKKAFLSSWSCFCWPYRASPSLAAKNIINLILVLTIW